MIPDKLKLFTGPNAPDSHEYDAPYSWINGLSKEVRTAIQEAFLEQSSTPAPPALRRLRALGSRLESGEIGGVLDGSWVTNLYAQQGSNPCITKSDVGNRAVVLTHREIRDIGTVSFINNLGTKVSIGNADIVPLSRELVLFPEDLGDHEHILTEEEVIEAIGKCDVPGYKITRKELDEEGMVYLLEVTIPGANPGEVTEYRYQRKGYFGQLESSKTTIKVVYYDAEGIPDGADNVAPAKLGFYDD